MKKVEAEEGYNQRVVQALATELVVSSLCWPQTAERVSEILTSGILAEVEMEVPCGSEVHGMRGRVGCGLGALAVKAGVTCDVTELN